jgi:hypothetical protein
MCLPKISSSRAARAAASMPQRLLRHPARLGDLRHADVIEAPIHEHLRRRPFHRPGAHGFSIVQRQYFFCYYNFLVAKNNCSALQREEFL